MTKLICFLAVLVMAACGSLAQKQPTVGVVKGLAGLGTELWQEERDPRDVLTRERIESSATDLLLFAPVTEDVASVFAAASRNRGVQTWVSDEGESLSLRNGVIIATRGLGNDVMATDISQVYPALVRGIGRALRINDYLDGEDRIVREQYTCEIGTLRRETLEIFQRKHETRVISETCAGEGGSFRNLYWIDTAGLIWQSRQWISPRVGAVDIQIL
jgi:hypothetical protein